MRAVPIGAMPPSTTARANLREAIKALTDGKGPDVIYDPVGGDFAEPAFRSIAWRGRYLVVGFASGPFLAAAEPGAAQGRIARGRVLGRLRQARAKANAAMMAELAQWYGKARSSP
jgi:NADPH2:quinone reductase